MSTQNQSRHPLYFKSGLYISAANQHALTSYEIKDSNDYVSLITDNDIQIGLCEIRGLREEQEDFVALDIGKEIQAFKKLSDAHKKQIHINTLKRMQSQFGQADNTGSTACVATAWRNQQTLYITTANLGDSSAYFILLNANNAITTSVRLNQLHNPSPESEEYARLKALDITPYQHGGWRLPTGLAMSRSLGDKESELCGLIHEPEVIHHQYTTEKDGRAYIVMGCDGLTEEAILDEKKIGDITQKHHAESLDQIALALVNAAFDHNSEQGSQDNISVILFPIKERVISAAIFDGHGGDQVSKSVSEHFYSTLHQFIQLAQDNGDQHDS